MKLSKKYLIWTLIFSVIALAINVFIIVHSCLDASTSTEASHGVVEITEEVINTVAPGTITIDNHDSFVSFIRKAFGHFGLFLISGFFTSLALFLIINPFNDKKYYRIVLIALTSGLFLANNNAFIMSKNEIATKVIKDKGYIKARTITARR